MRTHLNRRVRQLSSLKALRKLRLQLVGVNILELYPDDGLRLHILGQTLGDHLL